MKLKILKLLLLFLATGLFVSSKEKAEKNCTPHCLQYSQVIQPEEENTTTEIASYPITLAPGNFIFHL